MVLARDSGRQELVTVANQHSQFFLLLIPWPCLDAEHLQESKLQEMQSGRHVQGSSTGQTLHISGQSVEPDPDSSAFESACLSFHAEVLAFPDASVA